MTDVREPTEDLRLGRRTLDTVESCRIIEDLRWFEHQGVWGLHVRLSPPELPSTPWIPASTDWFVTIEPDYPFGKIGFFPAKNGGLTSTFPHQRRNGSGPEDYPWRSGNICTDTVLRALHRHGFDEEPRSSQERIRWHVLRAMAWLNAAARGELVHDGDFYELPVYPRSSKVRSIIGFGESRETFQRWQEIPLTAGLVHLVRHPRNEWLIVASRFTAFQGELLLDVPWGAEFSQGKDGEVGIWFRIAEAPVLLPWQAPATWRELWTAVQSAGTNPGSLLRQVPKRFRDALQHTLLIGFPIPRRFGEPPERMHWLGAVLPPLSRGEETVDGFRGPKGGWVIRDRRVVLDQSQLEWIGTENWAEDEISTRGRFSTELRSRSILLIGAGALGSAIAELLMRGGVYRIKILDQDVLQAGNLVRHSLTLADVGSKGKAKALADWLNQLNPHARVDSVEGWFPPDNAESIADVDLVLDCTADDDLLARLANFSWPEKKDLVSLSLGPYAKRLYLFAARGERFPRQIMLERLQPWLLEDREKLREDDLPWESIGCWSPIFPARVDGIRLFAAIAVKALDRWAQNPGEPRLQVFETDEEGTSVRQVLNG